MANSWRTEMVQENHHGTYHGNGKKNLGFSARNSTRTRKLGSFLNIKRKEGIKIFPSFESALNEAGARTIFIIGGGQIYSSLLPQCNELYITEVQQVIEEGDAFFPSFEKDFTPTETLEENKEFIIKKWKRITS